jgi:GNAT superfamily N-acetyltransferase
MARSDGLVERPLSLADVAAAGRLSTEARWDQTGDDWRLMIARAAVQGDAGLGLATADGELVASAMTLGYGARFGWISMVLVTEPWRGRGLASGLLRRCIDSLQARRLTPVLDATPDGRRIYLPLGFVDRYGLARMTAPAIRIEAPQASRAIVAADWPAILAYDTVVFGGDRADILRDLAQRAGARGRLIEQAGRLAGFALGRAGRTAWHVGPVVAEDAATAQALIADALAGHVGKTIIDIAADRAELRRWLEAAGFCEERPYSRMTLGPLEPFGDPSRLYVVAGPELG